MIYLFDKDEQLIKLIRKDVVKTALQKFELKDGYVSDRLTVEMRMLSDDDLQKVEYMAIQSINDTHDFHYFWIAQKNNTDNITTLVGVQSGIEELQKTVVYDQRPKDQLAKPVIDRLLDGTNWRARFIGGNQTRSTNFYYISTFEALKKVCSVWGLEMQFFVEMNGNKIGARYIDFKERIGKAVGSRVVYGHNALQILQEVERTNIYTALIGRGKGEETENGGFGRKLTFEDVEWTTPVAKPKGQRYVEIPSMTALYGIKNADGTMRPKIGTVDFQDETDADNLLKLTYEQLVNVSRPQVTFKTSTAYISNAEIGDTIRVVRHDKHIDYETRIFEITFNRLNDQSADIKLGDNIKGEAEKRRIQSAINESLDGFVENELKPAFEKLPEFLATADGKNTNWYSDEDPITAYPGKVLINDIWYKPDPEFEGEKIMLRWTGEAWEEILRTSDPDRIKRSIDQQFEDFNTSYDEAKALQDQQIADVLAKAGSVEDLANEAKTIGNQAIEEAGLAWNEAQQARDRIESVSTSASATAVNTANSLIAYANSMTAMSEHVTTVESTANAVKMTASETAKKLSSETSRITNLTTRTATTESELTKVKTAMSEVDLTLDGITGDVDAMTLRTKNVEDSIDGVYTTLSKIQVGGGNLVVGTGTEARNSSGAVRIYKFDRVSYPFETGTKMWISFDWSASNPTSTSKFRINREAVFTDGTATQWNNTIIINDQSSDIMTSAGKGHYSASFDWVKLNSQNVENVYLNLNQVVFSGTLTISNLIVAKSTAEVPYTQNSIDATLELAEYKRTINEQTASLSKQVKTIDGRVTNNETLSRQNAEGLLLKAKQTDLDSVTGRLTDAETNISVLSDSLKATVTKTEAEKIAKTTFDINASGISSRITEIQNTIPKEIGSVNYALGTSDKFSTEFTNFRTDGSPVNISLAKVLRRDLKQGDTITIYVVIEAINLSGENIQMRLQGAGDVTGWGSGTFPISPWRIFTGSGGYVFGYTATLNAEHISNNSWGLNLRVDNATSGLVKWRLLKVEKGMIKSDWSPAPEDLATVTAFNSVKDTVDAHTRTIGNIEGNVSQVTQTAQGLVQEVSGANGLKTQVSQLAGSWAVKNLTSNGAMLNQFNLLADGTNRIDGRLTHITGQTLIDNGVIKSAMIGNAQINTAHIGTIDAGQANIININASNITSGTITGINMRGGELTSLNGAVNFDLQSGHLNFLTSEATMRRQLAGYPTQFIKFDTGSNNGTVTVIGSNRGGNENPNDGNFAGIRIWNDTTSDGFYDYVDVTGDVINFTHKTVDGGSNTRRGWEMKSYGIGSDVSLRPIGYFSNAHITATEYRILNKSTNSYRDLSQVLDIIFDNFRNISEKGGFNRSYYSKWR